MNKNIKGGEIVKNIDPRIKAYSFVVLSMGLASLGPSVFMLLLHNTNMNREFGVMLFLLLGGMSIASMSFIGDVARTDEGKFSLKGKFLFKLFFSAALTAAQFFAFTISMQIGSVTETTMLVRLSPLLNVFMSAIFLDEKIKNKKLLTVATFLCLSGAFLLQGIKMSSLVETKAWFMFFGILTAFAMAGKNVINGSLLKYDKMSNSFIVSMEMILGATMMIPFLKMDLIALPNMIQVFGLIFLGLFTVAIPSYINLYSYKVIKSMGALSFFSYLLPLFGSIAAYYINRERGFNYFTLGFSFVVISIGIYIANKSIVKK